jgi:pimeloyl-ACP methyl ester carboxylesterase
MATNRENTTMAKVTSQDGTPIAFERSGDGPPIILISPALGDRTTNTALAALLAPHVTVINFDRRGRGDSGDTAPYAVEREIQDIEALINEAGGPTFLYGWSSGAALAIEAAAHGLPVAGLALYEPPFIVDNTRSPLPDDYVKQLSEMASTGRRGDAVELFMTMAAGVPTEYIGPMRADPMWREMEKLAHTLAYDGTIMGDNMSGKPLPVERWARATMPALVMDGGRSPDWMRNGARAAAESLPNAEYRTLADQDHGVDPNVLAPVLVAFFTAPAGHPASMETSNVR